MAVLISGIGHDWPALVRWALGQARGIFERRIGKSEGEQPIPESVEYDLWCGPGPKGPLMRKKLKYDWHWTWAYGNGWLTGLDVATETFVQTSQRGEIRRISFDEVRMLTEKA